MIDRLLPYTVLVLLTQAFVLDSSNFLPSLACMHLTVEVSGAHFSGACIENATIEVRAPGSPIISAIDTPYPEYGA